MTKALGTEIGQRKGTEGGVEGVSLSLSLSLSTVAHVGLTERKIFVSLPMGCPGGAQSRLKE